MSSLPSQSAERNAPKAVARKRPAKAQTAAPAKAKAVVKTPLRTAEKPVTAAEIPAAAKTRAKPAAKASPSKTPAAKSAAPVKSTAPAKAAKPVATAVKTQTSKVPTKAVLAKDGKHSGKKPKLVRDSFTFPAADYALIGSLKQRALKAGHEIKKSELLRAGLASLAALSDSALLKAVQGIDRLKPGRPGK